MDPHSENGLQITYRCSYGTSSERQKNKKWKSSTNNTIFLTSGKAQHTKYRVTATVVTQQTCIPEVLNSNIRV